MADEDAVDVQWVRHDIGGVVATLRVAGGRGRYRSLVDGERPDEVGLYAADLEGEADVGRRAEALLAAAATGATQEAGGAGGLVQLRVARASGAGSAATVAAGSVPDERAEAAALRAAALAAVDVCRAHPVATVRLGCALLEGDGPAAGLELAFTATGRCGAPLVVRPETAVIVGPGGDPYGASPTGAVWSGADAAPPTGLLGDDRTSLDGIFTPAVVAAGSTARMRFLDAVPAAAVEDGAVLAVQCLVHAPLDEGGTDPFPEEQALLVAAIQRPHHP